MDEKRGVEMTKDVCSLRCDGEVKSWVVDLNG